MKSLLPFFTNNTLTTLIFFLLVSGILNAQDTIPFRLGKDNRMYIKVIVNDSDPLNFIFDTGAGSMVANTNQTDKKINLTFNAEVDNRGANGISKQSVSQGNELRIGKFKRTDQELIGIPYPKEHYSFDGVIGYPFFEEYLVEIDYGQQHILIHKDYSTLKQRNSYHTLTMDLTEGVPFVDMLIFKEDIPVTIPVMIDTGYNGNLIVYHKMVKKHGLANQFPKTGTSTSKGTDGAIARSNGVLIPKATLGSIEFADLPANFNQTPSPISFTAILGGNALKEIHWVLDFKKKVVLLRAD